MENKSKYESVIVIRGTLKEEAYKKALNGIIEKIKSLVEISKIDELGVKKLAYEVQKNKTGYFVVFYFKATSQAIKEIERIYRIKDEVLKFITVSVED